MTESPVGSTSLRPTIEVAAGYSNANPSPILKLFQSRLDELVGLRQ